MRTRLVRRRAHSRRTPSGGTTFVRASNVCFEVRDADGGSTHQRTCPKCGAAIISVKMPKGGWAHFEGGSGLTRAKHPCLHRGENLSKARDTETFDLFEALDPTG
jgi:hypothetical protein